MPSISKHAEVSKERTGNSYRGLHEWMDPWVKDPSIARERHDITNIEENIQFVRDKWGDEGVKEFLYHIKEGYENKVNNNILNRGLRRLLGK